MNLQSFLEHLNREKNIPSFPAVCFAGKTYPLLFFSHIISFLHRSCVSIHRLDVVDSDIGLVKAQLSTAGFGGQSLYWLNNFHALTAKKQQEWLVYLQSYSGPHKILFFCDDAHSGAYRSNDQMKIITIPDAITLQEYPLIRFLVQGSSLQKSSFASGIAQHTQSLSLDSACLFAHYEVVVGNNGNDFFAYWIAHIIEPSSSLFLLTQHLFSKKTKLFFAQWVYNAENYTPPFWATFWADQVWRAYIYCDLMKQKKYDEAKRAQYKLPYSFINRDWSNYSLRELQKAHHFLSDMDFSLKNGGSEIGLELFYSNFFENKYKQ